MTTATTRSEFNAAVFPLETIDTKKFKFTHMCCVHGIRYCLNKMQQCHKAKFTHTFIDIGSKHQQSSSSSSMKQFQNWKFTIYTITRNVWHLMQKKDIMKKRWYFKQLKHDVCIWESSTNRWKGGEHLSIYSFAVDSWSIFPFFIIRNVEQSSKKRKKIVKIEQTCGKSKRDETAIKRQEGWQFKFSPTSSV